MHRDSALQCTVLHGCGNHALAEITCGITARAEITCGINALAEITCRNQYAKITCGDYSVRTFGARILWGRWIPRVNG